MDADSFTAEVAGLDDTGAGLVALDGPSEALCCHVPGALPGERIRAHVDHRSVHRQMGGPGKARRAAWGTLDEVLMPSPDRVAPACPAYGRCGGCTLMHMAYGAQLAFKREQVRRRLGEHDLGKVDVAACVSSPLVLGYRNQAKYVYAWVDDGQPVLGAYTPRSHEVVDLAGCRVVEPVLDQARAVVLQLMRARGIEPYHEIKRTGLGRYVILRANGVGQILATLVAARDEGWGAQELATELMARLPAVVGVVLNLNREPGNVLFARDERLLAGQWFLEDEMGGVRVRLASRSFFQANRAVGSRIYGDLVASLPDGLATAVDVYAGAGGIALSLLARAKEVIAIEENPAATEAAAALESARLGFITGDAGTGLRAVKAADLVVLNPPRKGCAPEVLAEVQRLRPSRLAYLSCDPQSLARDLAVLVRAGARITRVVPYDMMPHTPHVETLVTLSFGG